MRAEAGVADRLARGASTVMAAADLINLSGLLDDAKCFAFVRQQRWPDGVRCPGCASEAVIRDRCDGTQPCRQRHRCRPAPGASTIYGAGRPSAAAARVGAVPLLHGPEPLQSAVRPGAGPGPVRGAGHDRAVASRSARRDASGWARRARSNVLAGHKGQPAAVAKGSGSGAGAGWRARQAELRTVPLAKPIAVAAAGVARWQRTSPSSSA